MPRDGSNVYYTLTGTNGVPNTPIESTKYNANIADVAQDLNTPRPIVAGGTGATSAHTALVNLKGEECLQLITNYNSDPFYPGSFTSAAGATGAPNGTDAFSGICYSAGLANHMVVEARAVTTAGALYVRQKISGVWGAWILQAASTSDLDATYVNVSGDTMQGDLQINKASPRLQLNMTTATSGAFLQSYVAGVLRWAFFLGDGSAESGASVGNDLSLFRYSDAGGILGGGPAVYVKRSTGDMTLSGALTAGGAITSIGNLFVPAATVGLGGASTTPYTITMSGGTGTNGGAHMVWDKSASHRWYSGFRSGILNGTSDNLVWYTPAASKTPLELDQAGGFAIMNPNGVTLPPAAVALKIAVAGGGTQYGLAMQVAADTTNLQVFYNAAGTQVGSIGETSTSTSFNTSSSAELKEDLKSFDAGNIIDNTEVYDFAWKSTRERSYGVIAQQAIDVYPLAVTHSVSDEGDDFWGVDYSKYVPVLLQELKALRARVAELEGKVDIGAKPSSSN